MPNTPVRVGNRLASVLRQFQPVLDSAKSRDVNESDTVVIVTDMFSQLFGFDKYSELTSEVAIRGSYCDLAVKRDNKIQFLVEIKAIGIDLKESQTRQAVDYAANEGVDWVILTNGAVWKVYNVNFGKPIEPELVLELDIGTLDPKNQEHIDALFLLTREGVQKSSLVEYRAEREALSRFCIAAVVLSPPVVAAVRKELKRLSPDVRIDLDQVRAVMEREVLKRDALEGDRAQDARRRVARSLSKPAKAKEMAVAASSGTTGQNERQDAPQATEVQKMTTQVDSKVGVE